MTAGLEKGGYTGGKQEAAAVTISASGANVLILQGWAGVAQW